MDEHLRDELAAWFEFYRELGIEDFYSRQPGSDPSSIPELDATAQAERQSVPAPDANAKSLRCRPEAASAQDRPLDPAPLMVATAVQAISEKSRTSQGTPAHALNLFEAPPPARPERQTLEDISQDLGDCQRCKLAGGRRNIVFGQGNPRAELVFVGEGPGADEDEQGLPFVGRAGQLLNRMLQFVGIKREDVYICNVVKCRPPGNRTPEPDEIATCSPFLFRQIEAIGPRLVCCLGAPAVKTVLGLKDGILKIRGKFYSFGNSKALPTVHPAYVLRNPREEKLLREDFEKIRTFLANPR
jgi:uracil-DNA glycosylase family 4